MGATHGDAATFPRLADVIGFIPPEQLLAVAENVVKVQRDFGDRTNRKHARLKYTIEDRGIAWFVGRAGAAARLLAAARASLHLRAQRRPLRLDARAMTGAGT